MSEDARWQYGVQRIWTAEKERRKTDVTNLSPEDVADKLNWWGERGWELVNVIQGTTWHGGQVGSEDVLTEFAFFKRQRSVE